MPKTIQIWLKWAKQCLNVTSARESTCISQICIKKLFYIFKPSFNFFQIDLFRGGSNLGLEWPKVEKKGPKNYMCLIAIKNTCTTLKWVSKYDFIFANEDFFLFKNHLHSGLTRINPKTIRIWSKCAKEWLNVVISREPTSISHMGIKKLFCY